MPKPAAGIHATSCTAGLLVSLLAGPLGAVSCGTPQKNLLLVTVDTLRADRIGRRVAETLPFPRPDAGPDSHAAAPSGGGLAMHSLTPALDRLRSEGAAFEQMIVPVPRTSQSVASILTGLHPIRHGVRGLFWPLPPGCGPTLAELLGARGYDSAAFTSNLVLRPGQGFERGFALYDNPRSRWEGNGSEATVTDAIEWLRGAEARGGSRKAPWFLWLHLLDPHWPYEPAPPFDAEAGGVTAADRELFGRTGPADGREEDAGAARAGSSGAVPAGSGSPGAGDAVHTDLVFAGTEAATAAHLTALYDGEVAATDQAIGRLLQALEAAGLAESTVVVVTSDHGESLGEHGYWFAHGEYLYDETLRVPAIVRAPGAVPAGLAVTRLARGYDLMPTLLDLLDLPVPPGLDGVSHADELRGRPGSAAGSGGDAENAIYLESDRDLLRPGNPKRFLEGYAGSMRAWRTETAKLIRIPRPGGDLPGGDLMEAYDLAADPHELRPLDPARASGLAGAPAFSAAQSSLEEWERKAAAP